MQVRIRKLRNGLGIRIPKEIIVLAQLKKGSVLDVRWIRGKIEMKPCAGPKYDLKTLVSSFRKSQRHEEVCTGAPMGKEVW